MNLSDDEALWPQENNNKTSSKYFVSGDPLAAIYNEGFWRLHKVSPLYNLRYDTIKLKQYASKIRQALASTISSNTTVKYVVQMEEQVNLKYSEDDNNGLIINVLSSTPDVNSTSKISYSALLLSWGDCITLDSAIHLPYLLERGEQRIGTAVKASLQTIFDCNIKQFSFTQQQLLHFGFNFVENASSHNTDPFTLIYKTPQVDHKNKVNLSFEVGDIHIILDRIQDEVEKKSDLVTLAYKMLQNQIFHMIRLDIAVLELCEIQLPRAEVKSNGVIKMKTPEIVNCVFLVLNEISKLNSEKDISSASDTQ